MATAEVRCIRIIKAGYIKSTKPQKKWPEFLPAISLAHYSDIYPQVISTVNSVSTRSSPSKNTLRTTIAFKTSMRWPG